MPGPSSEYLIRLEQETGYGRKALEKVVRLLDLLREIQRHPLLARVLILKGGTALNLGFGKPPRLSVDLDFNYIGALGRKDMLRERPEVEDAVGRIANAQGYQIQTSRHEHAGGKWFLNYARTDGGRDRIEIDLNFLHRLPMLEPEERSLWTPEGDLSPRVRTLATEELYAGKACAMLDRMAPRDLFDMAGLPTRAPELVGSKRFRGVFVALSGALPHPVYTYEQKRGGSVNIDDLRNQLYPMLILGDTPDVDDLLSMAWEQAVPLLDLSDGEREFVDRLQVGELRPDLLFPDNPGLAARVNSNPMLLWKTQNAAAHIKGRGRR